MTLTELANKYQSDKGTVVGEAHNYTDGYEPFFCPLKEKAIRLLEIGCIYTPDNPEARSLKMWREYYPDAALFAFDILPVPDFEGGKVQSFQGDAADLRDLNLMYHTFGSELFDVIIEDASHSAVMQQALLGFMFPSVKPGGFYIIEDILNPNRGDLSEYDYLDNESTYDMLALRAPKSQFLTERQMNYLAKHIQEVRFITDRRGAFVSAMIFKTQ